MVSILIPTYNYDVRQLVKFLSHEKTTVTQEYEIIVADDGSNIPEILEANSEIEKMQGVTFLINEKNLGRTATRQKLATMAQFPWLLFLDADVLPEEK